MSAPSPNRPRNLFGNTTCTSVSRTICLGTIVLSVGFSVQTKNQTQDRLAIKMLACHMLARSSGIHKLDYCYLFPYTGQDTGSFMVLSKQSSDWAVINQVSKHTFCQTVLIHISRDEKIYWWQDRLVPLFNALLGKLAWFVAAMIDALIRYFRAYKSNR